MLSELEPPVTSHLLTNLSSLHHLWSSLWTFSWRRIKLKMMRWRQVCQ